MELAALVRKIWKPFPSKNTPDRRTDDSLITVTQNTLEKNVNENCADEKGSAS